MRDLVSRRSEGRCEVEAVCDNDEAVHHHWRRRININTASNGLHICSDCHEFIVANPQSAYEKGWLVRRNLKPARVPVFYRQWRWMLLDDDANTYIIPAPAGGIAN